MEPSVEKQDEQNPPNQGRNRRRMQKRLSVTDLVDPTKPWMLVDGTEMLGFFDFVPKHLRIGPWNIFASVALFVLIYTLVIMLIVANTLHGRDGRSIVGGDGSTTGSSSSVLDDFRLPDEAYEPYTVSWWYNLSGFVWCSYVWYLVKTDAYMGPVAFVSYTLWSWTIITLRHGLCVLSPFVSAVRIFSEMLRLPVLMSASVTFGVWNFILMPAICLVFIKDSDRRRKFVQFAFGFRLFNLHVLDIFFAILNASYAEPRRKLQLGDLNTLAIYMVTYLLFYYFVLDRFAIHLYPIFSPRVSWVVFPWLMVVGLCIGGYNFWEDRLHDAQY
mmetsp:Transcript_25602/g.60538  ORF Transcript_25602/g.60538 Transcript_25602/m.60538 type:complete len:329 (+) Transcript_25602:258-1244(+)